MDGGFPTPWPATRRQQSGGKSAASRYGPLLAERPHTPDAQRARRAGRHVTIVSDLPYPRIHNEGRNHRDVPRRDARMRRFAWAKFFEAGGGGKKGADVPADAVRWKKLALTRKVKLDIRAYIPQRRFIGQSREPDGRISEKIAEETRKVLER